MNENETNLSNEDLNNALEVNIAPPDDVDTGGEQKKSLLEKASSFFSLGIGEQDDSTSPPPEKEKKKPRGRRKAFSLTQYVSIISSGMIALLSSLIDDMYKPCLPSLEQANEIFTPLLSIADRHTHITDISPDTEDIMKSLAAITAYGLEARSTYILIRMEEKEKEKVKRYEQYNNIPTLNEYQKQIIHDSTIIE
jgi:hypothetical protein